MDLTARIARLGARRIGVDGPDAAGKTTFATALAAALGYDLLHADDFLLPDDVRARTAYPESFDTAAIAAAVRAHAGPLVAEGVFLLRPELRGLWDLAVYLHVEPAETVRRALLRDGERYASAEALERRYRERYLPGLAAYRERARPAEHADVVVDNTDPAAPRVVAWRGPT